MDATLKEWITRPEIERMFWVSTNTCARWLSEGKFGPPIGEVPNKSGHGRQLNMYSMKKVLEVYELEYIAIAQRAIARGADRTAFPEYLEYIEKNNLRLPTLEVKEEPVQPVILWVWSPRGVSDGYSLVKLPYFDLDAPVYDGLPFELNLDITVESPIPDKPDLWEYSDSLLCPPFAGISIAL